MSSLSLEQSSIRPRSLSAPPALTSSRVSEASTQKELFTPSAPSSIGRQPLNPTELRSREKEVRLKTTALMQRRDPDRLNPYLTNPLQDEGPQSNTKVRIENFQRFNPQYSAPKNPPIKWGFWRVTGAIFLGLLTFATMGLALATFFIIKNIRAEVKQKDHEQKILNAIGALTKPLGGSEGLSVYLFKTILESPVWIDSFRNFLIAHPLSQAGTQASDPGQAWYDAMTGADDKERDEAFSLFQKFVRATLSEAASVKKETKPKSADAKEEAELPRMMLEISFSYLEYLNGSCWLYEGDQAKMQEIAEQTKLARSLLFSSAEQVTPQITLLEELLVLMPKKEHTEKEIEKINQGMVLFQAIIVAEKDESKLNTFANLQERLVNIAKSANPEKERQEIVTELLHLVSNLRNKLLIQDTRAYVGKILINPEHQINQCLRSL